jgi:hypothetical protein
VSGCSSDHPSARRSTRPGRVAESYRRALSPRRPPRSRPAEASMPALMHAGANLPAANVQRKRSAVVLLLIRFPVDLDADVTPAFARPSCGLNASHSLVLLDVASRSSPTTRAVSGPRLSASRGAVKNSGDGLPRTRARSPVAYSSSRTHPPVSRCSPSSRAGDPVDLVATSSRPSPDGPEGGVQLVVGRPVAGIRRPARG